MTITFIAFGFFVGSSIFLFLRVCSLDSKRTNEADALRTALRDNVDDDKEDK